MTKKLSPAAVKLGAGLILSLALFALAFVSFCRATLAQDGGTMYDCPNRSSSAICGYG